GWNNLGQCNVPAAAQSGVIAVAAGYDYSWALKDDGTLIGWGDNDYGWISVPAGLQGGLVAVSSVAYHTVAQVAAAYSTLDQTEVFAGDSATGTVRLAQAAPAGGTVVGLSADDASVTVPTSATVPEGATTATFPVFTNSFFGSDRTVKVQTSLNGTATVPFKLKVKGTPVNTSFSTPSTIGGSTSRPVVTVSVNTPLTAATTFSLTYDEALTGPTSVTIPSGQTSASFSLTTNPLYTPKPQGVNVLHQGMSVSNGTINVMPIKGSVLFDASSVLSGETSTGTIYLNAAVRSATVVNLSSDNAAVPVPASVTVKATGRFATFTIPTKAVGTTQYAKVTADIGGNTSYGNLKLLAAPGVKSLTLPTSVYGNG
ncbi:MAG: hypothetical protein EON96_19485, partial [Caulobacteraceae bacterium]